MSTNMTGFKRFSKNLHPCALKESSLSIGRVNIMKPTALFSGYVLILSVCSRCIWVEISVVCLYWSYDEFSVIWDTF